MDQRKDKFNSNFGFLMACLGSAIGLGNLWSFPYKLGAGGGFAFLLIYMILCVVVGYPLILSEIAVGRKSQRAAIEAYTDINPKFRFNGVLQTTVPVFLISFYCTFGGYITKYLVASIAGLTGNAEINTTDPSAYFEMNLLSHGDDALIWMLLFLVITMVIVMGGVSGGIEKFCKFAMPALFVLLVIIVIRSCTLPNGYKGLVYLFKPNFDGMKTGSGFFETIKLAGGQMFFSLSIASACLIAYGSYLDKGNNLERDAAFIAIGDTVVAILAGMAIMPAVFSFGLEPGAGPSLLFISMTQVFQSMGFAGRIFQLLFWLLVFFAALSSSIGMMEGSISSVLDTRIKNGKKATRYKVTLTMGLVALVGNTLTTLDCLGASPSMQWLHILGQPDVLDVWDAIGEGVLMPFTGLIMAVILGWFTEDYIDDEVMQGSNFASKKLYDVCIKYIGPVFMAMIVYAQITSFWGN